MTAVSMAINISVKKKVIVSVVGFKDTQVRF
jgi:hypothetical protein